MNASPKSSSLRVALVHDYLREYGGAERVVETLHRMYPAAPVYVAFTDPAVMGIHWQRFADWDIRVSWLTKIPLHKKLFSPLRMFAPQFFRSFDLSAYDMIISSSNAYFGKAVRKRLGAHHLCYCHTPARSLYGYTTMTDWEQQPFTRFFGRLLNHYLRVVDYRVAQAVDVFIANSQEVRQRIAKFYRREAVVIFPPVAIPSPSNLELFRRQAKARFGSQFGKYYLFVNRLALAKHPELAVHACTQLKVPLKVVGSGPILGKLRGMAGRDIEFLGAIEDAELHVLYAGAKALVYPVEDEDFGMVPVEAMGHGIPVIAHRSGGPTETIVEGKTGWFFDELSSDALQAIIAEVEDVSLPAARIVKHAQKFSEEEFVKKIRALVREVEKNTTGVYTVG